MAELKPCPFCGCSDKLVPDVYCFTKDVAFHLIECDTCGARGCDTETEQEAVEVWNRISDAYLSTKDPKFIKPYWCTST